MVSTSYNAKVLPRERNSRPAATHTEQRGNLALKRQPTGELTSSTRSKAGARARPMSRAASSSKNGGGNASSISPWLGRTRTRPTDALVCMCVCACACVVSVCVSASLCVGGGHTPATTRGDTVSQQRRGSCGNPIRMRTCGRVVAYGAAFIIPHSHSHARLRAKRQGRCAPFVPLPPPPSRRGVALP